MRSSFRTRAWLGLVSLFVFVSTAYADGLSDRYKIAEPLGVGAFKEVYAVEGHPELAIGILRPTAAARIDMLVREKATLERLAAAGVPTATVLEISTYQGRNAYLQKRFATGDRAPDWFTKRWEVLNETSIEDCRKIQAALVAANMDVLDAQFLVGADGHIVVNDPITIKPLKGSAGEAKPVLDGIERAAREAIDARNEKLLQGMPDAQDPVVASTFVRAKVALEYGDAAGEAALKEALLHHLESGETTPEAREVAKSIRDGKFESEFLRSNEAPRNADALAISLEDAFPRLARDLVSAGTRRRLEALAGALEADLTAVANAFAFLKRKNVAGDLARDSNLPSEPSALLRALAETDRAVVDDAERARLEALARGILERGTSERAPSVGITTLIEDRIDRPAAEAP
jgi:hypothetical protein